MERHVHRTIRFIVKQLCIISGIPEKKTCLKLVAIDVFHSPVNVA